MANRTINNKRVTKFEFLIAMIFLLPRNQRNKLIHLKPSSGEIRTTRKMRFISFLLIYDLRTETSMLDIIAVKPKNKCTF